MKRALVLGGGGVIGVAWETGLITALADGGLKVETMAAVVGTSAGSIVGCQALTGRTRTLESRDDERDAAPIDFSKIDPAAMGKIFTMWGEMGPTTPEGAAAIGAIARVQNREGAERFVERFSASIGVDAWPESDFRVCTVDTVSGKRRVITRDSGVPVTRALAASSAVPGLFPSVEIEGVLYMDGQVQSSTNADVLLGEGFDEVFVAMPTNEHNGRLVGKHAELSAEAEMAALRSEGASVHFTTPSAEDVGKMGQNLMDPKGVPAAYEAGLAAGRRWLEQLG